MADKKSLERIGLAFGLVTAAVVLTAAMVVRTQLNLGLVGETAPIVSASIGSMVR